MKNFIFQQSPNSKWDRTKPLHINDSLSQMIYAKSVLARLAIRFLVHLRQRLLKKGKPNLNLFFLTNMPFRVISKISGGNVSIEMAEHIVTIVNGHVLKGIVRFIKSYFVYNIKKK